MAKQRVFLTGATGTMGFLGMQALLEDAAELDLVILARPSEKNKKLLKEYEFNPYLTIVWGDLTSYEDVKACVKNSDVVLHVGAFVSPEADYHPNRAMKINYGSTAYIVKAIEELGQQEKTSLVYIGTVAQTGDRMPPIHWGRVGDPLKPSVFDYYAVSKIAAERHVIESGLPKWASLRQTGIIGPAMSEIQDSIMFHNCLDNVLEYASDRDSARLLRNICRMEREGTLGGEFWGHIFNIGGGESCRSSTFDMYSRLFGELGIKDLGLVMDSNWCATRNFHGHYYLDSDKLENILHFRNDGMEYYYGVYLKSLGIAGKLAKLAGQKTIAKQMRKRFEPLTKGEHGTVSFVAENREGHIAAYWGSREAYDAIPPMDEYPQFTDWDTVIPISHGYDETKPESELALEDVKGAAEFRGGECVAKKMETGNWTAKLGFKCAFGHSFEASPRLVLEGGHWCPTCERESWNYYERAKVDPYFAQVWDPLHPADEKPWKYDKVVSELDVELS